MPYVNGQRAAPVWRHPARPVRYNLAVKSAGHGDSHMVVTRLVHTGVVDLTAVAFDVGDHYRAGHDAADGALSQMMEPVDIEHRHTPPSHGRPRP